MAQTELMDTPTTPPSPDESAADGSTADAPDAKRRYLEALERKRSKAAGPGQGGPGSTGGGGATDTHGHTQRTFRRKSGGGG